MTRGQSSKPEYIEDGKSSLACTQNVTYMFIDDVIWDLIGAREDIALGLDHTNKTRSFWGKTDSIFIR